MRLMYISPPISTTIYYLLFTINIINDGYKAQVSPLLSYHVIALVPPVLSSSKLK